MLAEIKLYAIHSVCSHLVLSSKYNGADSFIGTSMLDLLETLFSRYGIRSVRFDGKMDRASRDQTLQTFKGAGGPKVILISTKCGGVG